MSIYIYIYIYACACTCQPYTQSRCDTWSIFKRDLTVLNSVFSFDSSRHTKVKEPSLPHYLSIAGDRIAGFISFPRVLVLCEIQTTSSRI